MYSFVRHIVVVSSLALPVLSFAQATDKAAEADRGALLPKDVVQECSAETLRRIAWSLNMREQALDRRERMMGQRETDLVTAQEELQAWITDLEGVRDQIAGMLNLHSDEDKKIKALMEMVENMRPKQAASVLSEMDLELTVKVVDRMDRAKAGKAMAVMTPKKAAEVAEKLTRPITVGGKP